jgi:hypothetical protein
MTKYSCDIHTAEDWESIALFSDKVSFEAMGAFIGAEFECGNSLCAPCDAIRVVDMTTGEIILEADLQSVLEDGAHIINDTVVYPPDGDDDPADIDDDCGFDPYLGCFTDDC